MIQFGTILPGQIMDRKNREPIPISSSGILASLLVLAVITVLPIPVGTLAVINENAAFGRDVLTNTERMALVFFDAVKALSFVAAVLDIGTSGGENLNNIFISYAAGAILVLPILISRILNSE